MGQRSPGTSVRRLPAVLLAFVLALGVAAAATAEPEATDGTSEPPPTPPTAAPATPAPASPFAAAAAPRAPEPLTIATRHVPPFAIRGPDGSWAGIAIELWEEIADALDVDYVYADLPLTKMLDAVAEGRADAAVAALTITADRERRVDFTHPFLTSGLGIAVQQHPGGGLRELLKRLVSPKFLGVLLGLLGLLTLTGGLVWLAERQRNEHFQSDPARGIGGGIWWSAVTMTTVGYGDKAPVTLTGRVLALVWMFTSVIIISGITAAITTALTVGELAQSIHSVDDLYAARVLTATGSTSQGFLDERGLRHEALDSLPKALTHLAEDRADAVVYDAPILRWMIAEQYADRLRVLPLVLQRQDYGIALPQKSPARERINSVLLTKVRGAQWQDLLTRYLGRTD